HEHDAEHHAPIAHAVGDERFLCRIARFFPIDVVTDEQVRAEADALPADEHQQQVVRQHERQHHEHEEVQIGEEAIEAAVAVHVADGEDVYQEADERDEAGIDAAQPIHAKSEVRAETTDLNPRPKGIKFDVIAYEHARAGPEREP